MEITGRQITLPLLAFITGAAVAVLFACLRKHRETQYLAIGRGERTVGPPISAISGNQHCVQPRISLEPEPTLGAPTPRVPAPILASATGTELSIIDQHERTAARATRLSRIILQPRLERLLENSLPFEGLAISVGINDTHSSAWYRDDLIRSVGTFIASFLTKKEFCCRTSCDEFVIVCPGESGAAMHQRLQSVVASLWEYQLTRIGAESVLFSWGSAQLREQSLREVIGAATDTMREMQRLLHPAKLASAPWLQ